MELLYIKCAIVLCLSSDTYGSERVKRGFCSTRNLDIPNGDYSLRSGNSVAKFTCNRGFQIYGVEQIVCFGSTWSSDPPMCISNTCEKIPPTSILRISEEFDGAVLTFTCAALYKLMGSKKLICDGTTWNDRAPTCEPWEPPLSCDFESTDLCGWSHHDKDDQDWRWNTGSTGTSRTGPSHDHTLGDGGNGHYMYFESSSPTRTGHKAILQSPLYPADYSRQKCFSFWYHVLGDGDIGDLELFFKPESLEDLSSLKPVFLINEDGGDVWYEESIQATQQTEPFQIMLVATRGTSYRSDFAIDDFKLGDCAGTLAPVNTTLNAGTTATKSAAETTQKLTTITQITTQKPVTTQKTTKEPLKTTTKAPSTTVTKQATTTAIRTTQKTEKPTPKPSKGTQSTVRNKKTTQKLTNPTAKTSTESSTNKQPKKTLKPIINPNVPHVQESMIQSRDQTSKIVYIIIGVGLIVVIAGGIGVGIYFYRRSKKRRFRQRDSISSTNPLYKAMNNDEAAVQFAAVEHAYDGGY